MADSNDTTAWRELVERYKEDYPDIAELDENDRQYVFLAYYSLTRCDITKSCIRAKVSKPRTFYEKWLKNEKFKEIIENEKKSMVEVLENDLFNLAQKSVPAVIFALCNLAPDKWRNKYYTDNLNKNVTVDDIISQFINPKEIEQSQSDNSNEEVKDEPTAEEVNQ